MAEVEVEDVGSKVAEAASGASAGMGPDPEIDQVGVALILQKAALKYVVKNADKIMERAAQDAVSGRDSAAKLLFDWAFKVLANGTFADLPQSFAAELWEISKTLLAEVEK
jgi:hypothetical protein